MSGRQIFGLGAAACVACCIGPIVGFIGGIGVLGILGAWRFGVLALVVAGAAIGGLLAYRSARADDPAAPVPVELSRRP